MNNCQIPVALAYFLTIYTIASIVYLIGTHSLGTPFKDSLTPEQLKIKQEAVSNRTRMFYYGVFGGIVLMVIWRPFNNCNCE